MVKVTLEVDSDRNNDIHAIVKGGVWSTENDQLALALTQLSAGLIRPLHYYPNTDVYIANKIIKDFFNGRGSARLEGDTGEPPPGTVF